MESSGNSKGGLLTAGGVLSIVAGVSQIISGLLVASFVFCPEWSLYLPELGFRMLFMPFLPEVLWEHFWWAVWTPGEFYFVVCAFVLGIVAIVGGVSTIRRKRFSLSLAGAICALPSVLLGLLAIIFVSVSKREFGASEVNGK